MPEPKIDIERILADLESESQLYAEMIEVSERSLAGVRSGDSEAVAAAVEAKQEILAALDRIDSRLRPVKAEWRTLSESLSEPERERVESAMRDVQAVLAKLIDVENEAQKEIEARRDSVLEKLRGMRSRKNVRKAYGGPKPDETRFLDEQT